MMTEPEIHENDFSILLTDLQNAFGRELKPPHAKAYYNALKRYPRAAVAAAFNNLVQTRDLWPSIALCRQAIQAVLPDRDDGGLKSCGSRCIGGRAIYTRDGVQSVGLCPNRTCQARKFWEKKRNPVTGAPIWHEIPV